MKCWPTTVALLAVAYATSALALSEVICPGDCDYDRTTAINELVSGVNIALDRRPVDTCRGFDLSGDGAVTVNELVAGVGSALRGCPLVRLIQRNCAFTLSAEQAPGVECGDAIVREDRSRTDGRTVRIPFAVLKATGSNPVPDPLVYLSGGPGGPALQYVPVQINGPFASFLGQRDLVFFDQRGTGESLPSLDCPEWRAAFSAFIGEAQSISEDSAALLSALQVCHDRLQAEGVNLAAYTSSASAHDLEELLLALGYQQWNLYGISYGTRLGLTALRDTPDHIRSIGLDSNVPVQEHLIANTAADFERSLNTLFAGCLASPACAAAFPNLEQRFYTLVAQLNANPLTLHPTDPDGEPFTVVITGDRLLLGIQQALYDTALIPLIPLVVASAADGDYDLLTAAAGQLAVPGTIAWGMYYSIGCNEEEPFLTPEIIDAANAAVREEIRTVGLTYVTQFIVDVCDFWGSPPPPAIENDPVISDIPALVLAGEYDPVTPPEYSELIASNLSRSSYFEFAGTGHGVLIDRTACASAIARRFLADPSQPPDASCVDDIPPPTFVVP